jgi:hypothetical protein
MTPVESSERHCVGGGVHFLRAGGVDTVTLAVETRYRNISGSDGWEV